ncbi:UNVERIFIED_CONTAM: hypothetical protein ABIE34_000286 [Jeotgalibacillus campisalis]
MHHLILALTVTPSPDPTGTLRPGLSEDQVTPGTWGFVLTAFIVILTTFLIVDMVRRIRRVRYRAQVEEARLAAEAGNAEAGNMDGGSESAAEARRSTDENGDGGPKTR